MVIQWAVMNLPPDPDKKGLLRQSIQRDLILDHRCELTQRGDIPYLVQIDKGKGQFFSQVGQLVISLLTLASTPDYGSRLLTIKKNIYPKLT